MSFREDEDPPRIIDRRASQAGDAGGGQNEKSEAKENETKENTEESLAEQLAREREKADSYLASWQRAAADYQNYKRRVEQEREEFGRLANASLIINLLPILDDLERALENVDTRLAGLTWLDGIRLIHRKFQALLEMNGVEEIPAEGLPFDPNVHEAVMYGEGEEGKVTTVVQKGYKLGGRVLRPAMVVVGGKKKEES
ncbi:MAG TPA: nucleotide exchange factor GrpE [Dehalococcoidia bacterium]|nr:nucleotide exchange factor GrpE [Dehalococcoidia bacterium]